MSSTVQNGKKNLKSNSSIIVQVAVEQIVVWHDTFWMNDRQVLSSLLFSSLLLGFFHFFVLDSHLDRTFWFGVPNKDYEKLNFNLEIINLIKRQVSTDHSIPFHSIPKTLKWAFLFFPQRIKILNLVGRTSSHILSLVFPLPLNCFLLITLSLCAFTYF